MHILLPARFVFDQEPRVERCLDAGVEIELEVAGLWLDLLGRTEDRLVCYWPCCDDE